MPDVMSTAQVPEIASSEAPLAALASTESSAASSDEHVLEEEPDDDEEVEEDEIDASALTRPVGTGETRGSSMAAWQLSGEIGGDASRILMAAWLPVDADGEACATKRSVTGGECESPTRLEASTRSCQSCIPAISVGIISSWSRSRLTTTKSVRKKHFKKCNAYNGRIGQAQASRRGWGQDRGG